MKRIVYINAWGNGSTGKIIDQLKVASSNADYESLLLYGRGVSATPESSININTQANLYLDALYSRVFDNHGRNSKGVTKKAIKILNEYKPDLIHLHNLHGYWINYILLFNYINANSIPVIWTLHDCWAITGHCAYYQYLGCKNQEYGCGKCPGINHYPKSFADNSKKNFNIKSEIFTSVKNMHIVTPSEWLANLVSKSYLNKYPCTVINNIIDSNTFKPTDYEYLYQKYGIPQSKKIVLYVAMSTSDPWKGFDILIKAAENLPEDYCVVIVGNCKLASTKKIINVGRTDNQTELAAFYSMADVLANPSLDDNYPTVNLEALACGLPIAAFFTGGIPEQVDEKVGILSKEKTANELCNSIIKICQKGKGYYSENCIKKITTLLSKQSFIEDYTKLYKSVNLNK